ncbi:hypothetical protein H4582DRAFT_2057033 [Lactarius indigo]|nr:hypothetical protein H4582DRAFT_2057033 [Lactarius indigo]
MSPDLVLAVSLQGLLLSLPLVCDITALHAFPLPDDERFFQFPGRMSLTSLEGTSRTGILFFPSISQRETAAVMVNHEVIERRGSGTIEVSESRGLPRVCCGNIVERALETPLPSECGHASAEVGERLRGSSTSQRRLYDGRHDDDDFLVALAIAKLGGSRLRTLPLLAVIITSFLALPKASSRSALGHISLHGSLRYALAVEFPTFSLQDQRHATRGDTMEQILLLSRGDRAVCAHFRISLAVKRWPTTPPNRVVVWPAPSAKVYCVNHRKVYRFYFFIPDTEERETEPLYPVDGTTTSFSRSVFR